MSPLNEHYTFLIDLVFPTDLDIDDLLMAERRVGEVAIYAHLYKAEALAEAIQVVLAAYRRETGEEPVADLSSERIEEYVLFRWKNGGQEVWISATDLANQAARRFGIAFSSANNPFVVIAQESIS